MWEIFTPYRDLTNVSLILRLVLAMVVGSVIGMERTYKNHPAGLRTHMLVCIGSALVMSTNQYVSEYFELEIHHDWVPKLLAALVFSVLEQLF